MIEYHYENDFILVDSDKIRIWIEDVIKKEKKNSRRYNLYIL